MSEKLKTIACTPSTFARFEECKEKGTTAENLLSKMIDAYDREQLIKEYVEKKVREHMQEKQEIKHGSRKTRKIQK